MKREEGAGGAPSLFVLQTASRAINVHSSINFPKSPNVEIILDLMLNNGCRFIFFFFFFF